MSQQGGGRSQRQQSGKAIQPSDAAQAPPLNARARDIPDPTENLRLIGYERSEMYSGPLPHPEILKQYNDALPGAGDRIFQQFEEEAKHRRATIDKLVANDIFMSRAGLVGGFVLGIVMIYAGIQIADHNAWAGAGVIGSGIAAVLAAFFKGIHGRGQDMPDDEPPKRSTKKK